MELIYAALLLHSAKKTINEESISKILSAAGIETDAAKIKALVAALEGVNIDEIISKAAMPVVPAAPVAATQSEKKEEVKEESKEKKAEEAAAGLSALFG
ncbi:MAG: 50S ribosomal protein P1 [Candidatus Aenigmatarchaeota archaeon]|nr:50S ribosomal protein P1 [Candidatus Aenigmarchaeota archaeon]